MSSKSSRSIFRSLSFRLSLTYAACSVISMAAVLVICYLFLEGSLRRRTDVYLAQEVPEYRALLESQNLDVLKDALAKEVESEGVDQIFFRLIDPEGHVVFSTDVSAWTRLSVDQQAVQAALAHVGKPIFFGYHDEEHDVQGRIAYGAISDELVLQLGESLEGVHTLLRQFRIVFAAATLAFLICSLFAGAYMARRALAGVQRVTQAAVHITAGAWEHRVPVSRYDDEIDELAKAFNTMVDRIEVLFRELRDVTDDIAHDLRTPLMRIRGEAEMALRETAPASFDGERCGSVLEECDGMLHFINTMLEISQTEAGAAPMERSALALAPLVEDVCELFRPVAEDKTLTLSCALEALPPVSGEASRLNRVFVHLLDNAVKYTPPGGAVCVTGRQEDGEVVVEIRDTGIGIRADALDSVFNRFYRADGSRSTAGNGLGLSLARAIVRAHEGDITVSSVEGEGSCFEVRLPIAADVKL